MGISMLCIHNSEIRFMFIYAASGLFSVAMMRVNDYGCNVIWTHAAHQCAYTGRPGNTQEDAMWATILSPGPAMLVGCAGPRCQAVADRGTAC